MFIEPFLMAQPSLCFLASSHEHLQCMFVIVGVVFINMNGVKLVDSTFKVFPVFCLGHSY